MDTKNIYGPEYKKPWVRRSFPHQRTHLSDHFGQVALLAYVLVLVAVVGLMFLVLRAG